MRKSAVKRNGNCGRPAGGGKAFWKKPAGTLLAAVMALSLAGCGGEAGEDDLSGLAARNLMENLDGGRTGESASGGSGSRQDGAVDSGSGAGDNGPGGSGTSASGGAGGSGTSASGGVGGSGTSASGDADEPLPLSADHSAYAAAFTDFAIKLFAANLEEGENALVSPLSVMSALGMAEGGAEERTLSQMEQVFGMTRDAMNAYLPGYLAGLPSDGKNSLKAANSIWVRDREDIVIEEDFLRDNVSLYGADVYQALFDDSTLKDINSWVARRTEDMIPEILDEIPDDAVLYLINALAFDAEWQNAYYENEVWEEEFTCEDGESRKAQFMHSDEFGFLENELSRGFLKYYAGREYAFAALLPNEGVTVEELVNALSGDELHALLSEPQAVKVRASMPKFEAEYGVELKNILVDMGMADAFTEGAADFSGMGHSDRGDFYMSRVLHKTFIAVDEKGTRAGAATAVEMMTESAVMEPERVEVIDLDRPFVYMIIDCKESLPVFIGTLESL